MKKLLAMFICLVLVMSVASCDKENADLSKGNAQESSTEDKTPYSFISEQERLSWKNKIAAVISSHDLYSDYEVLGHNFLGMALMDLNLDNTPELIAAYAGGSMGNVCVIAYDLETAEKLCSLGATPHYKDPHNVYLCVHRNNEGEYLIVNEGALRGGLEWYTITSSLNDQFELDALFKELESSDDDIRYYYDGNEVDKAEFDDLKAQFKSDYKEIKETQIKIVYWEDIDTSTEEGAIFAMADALVNSEQQFIDFGADKSTQKT